MIKPIDKNYARHGGYIEIPNWFTVLKVGDVPATERLFGIVSRVTGLVIALFQGVAMTSFHFKG